MQNCHGIDHISTMRVGLQAHGSFSIQDAICRVGKCPLHFLGTIPSSVRDGSEHSSNAKLEVDGSARSRWFSSCDKCFNFIDIMNGSVQ